MYHRESRLPSVFLIFLGGAVSEQLQDLQTKCCFCYFTKCTILTFIYLYKKNAQLFTVKLFYTKSICSTHTLQQSKFIPWWCIKCCLWWQCFGVLSISMYFTLLPCFSWISSVPVCWYRFIVPYSGCFCVTKVPYLTCVMSRVEKQWFSGEGLQVPWMIKLHVCISKNTRVDQINLCRNTQIKRHLKITLCRHICVLSTYLGIQMQSNSLCNFSWLNFDISWWKNTFTYTVTF